MLWDGLIVIPGQSLEQVIIDSSHQSLLYILNLDLSASRSGWTERKGADSHTILTRGRTF